MVLSFLDQLQMFYQLYLIDLLGLITNLGLLKVEHLIYPRLSIGFGMLVSSKSVMELQVRHLVLFLLFSVIDSFGWFWMGSLHKSIQLMLEFVKVPFLVLHFPYYTLMTFLIVISVILLSMLMKLPSTVSVITHLICGSN